MKQTNNNIATIRDLMGKGHYPDLNQKLTEGNINIDVIAAEEYNQTLEIERRLAAQLIVNPLPSTADLPYGFSMVENVNPEYARQLGLITIAQSSEVIAYNSNIEQQKALYQSRRQSFRPLSWLELGKENGLWQTKEELNEFRIALTVYARSTGRGEGWVVVVMNGIATNGMSIYWDEWTNGLQIGTIDHKEWEVAPGKINPSFKSYLEQMKFGDAGNNTAKAAELAAQALLNPLKAAALWQEYQRRLERELAEKGKCDRLGVAYLAPVELVPKVEIGIDRTLETQRLLAIDRPTQIDRLVHASDAVPVIPESEEYPPLPEDLRRKLEGAIGRVGAPEPALVITKIETKIEPPSLIDRVADATRFQPPAPIDSDTIVQEVFGNNNLYKRNPHKANVWFEENRDRLSAWFETLPERLRSRHLEINPWLKF